MVLAHIISREVKQLIKASSNKKNDVRGLVLSGGTGTRLRPLTNTTTKQLLPIANKPTLFYILDIVMQAGIKSTGVVVSPEWGEQVKETVGDGSKWGMDISYIVQSEPAGLAHAVKTAENFLGDAPFLMILGDNVYKFNVKKFMTQFEALNCDALLMLKEVDNPSDFGIAELDSDGKVISVQEKVPKPRSNLALAGIYLFHSPIHEAIKLTQPSSARAELEITDAIQKLIGMGKDVRGYVIDGWWLDTGDKHNMLKANQAVLEEFITTEILGHVDSGSQITGKVQIMKGATIKNSVIRGPVSIAEDCLVRNSSVGPFVSLGASTIVEDSQIEDSVVLEHSHIQGTWHLTSSFLGQRTKLVGQNIGKVTISLCLGDDAVIEA